mgnify:CR=1 FL=1
MVLRPVAALASLIPASTASLPLEHQNTFDSDSGRWAQSSSQDKASMPT